LREYLDELREDGAFDEIPEIEGKLARGKQRLAEFNEAVGH
jgi:hypothetical protein